MVVKDNSYKPNLWFRYKHGHRRIHKRRRSYKKKFWDNNYKIIKYFITRKRKKTIMHDWVLNIEDNRPPLFTKPSDSIHIYTHPLTQLAGNSTEMVRYFTKKPQLLLGDVTGLEGNVTYDRLSSGIILFGEDCDKFSDKIFDIFNNTDGRNIPDVCGYLYKDPYSWTCIDFVDSYVNQWLDISVDILKEGNRVTTPMSWYFGYGPSYLYFGGIYLQNDHVLINLRYGALMFWV